MNRLLAARSKCRMTIPWSVSAEATVRSVFHPSRIPPNPFDFHAFIVKLTGIETRTTDGRMGVFQYRNGILCCESAPLDRIARTVGTPFFVYSRKRLIANWNAAEKPLARTPHLTCYAVKANANPHLIRLFAERGAGVDIVSGGELRLALLAGVPADRVLFSGVGKTDAEIGAAVTAGVYSLNVESFDELSAVSRVAVRVRKKARVSIRVNPRVDPRTHPYIATGLRESKFGIAAERAVEAFRLAASLPGITVAGVHCHIGSQILETSFDWSGNFVQSGSDSSSLTWAGAGASTTSASWKPAGIPIPEGPCLPAPQDCSMRYCPFWPEQGAACFSNPAGFSSRTRGH
jgi:hypothetical protein